MNVLIARYTTESAVHEIVRREGGYFARTYFANPESEMPLTVREAGERVDMMRRGGGQVFAPLGESLKVER